MPISFKIPDPSTGLDLETLFTGRITPDHIIDYVQQVVKIHDSWRGRRVLIVFAEDSMSGGFNYVAINRLVAFIRAFNQPLTGSRTVVVADRPMTYGLIRMYCAMRDPPYEFQAFRHREEALCWLGRPVND